MVGKTNCQKKKIHVRVKCFIIELLILLFSQRRVLRLCIRHVCIHSITEHYVYTRGKLISKLQNVIEKKRMEIMTYKQHLYFNVISIQI